MELPSDLRVRDSGSSSLLRLLTTQLRKGRLIPSEAAAVWRAYIQDGVRTSRPTRGAAVWGALLDDSDSVEGALTAWRDFLETGEVLPVQARVARPDMVMALRNDERGQLIGRPNRPPPILFQNGGGGDEGPPGGGGGTRPSDEAEAQKVCACCPVSEIRVKKTSDFQVKAGDRTRDFRLPRSMQKKDQVEHRRALNHTNIEVAFRLGVDGRGGLLDCDLEWWEFPSNAGYRGQVVFPKRRNTVAGGLWNLLAKSSNTFREWNEAKRQEKLSDWCAAEDKESSLTVTLRDWPGITPEEEGQIRCLNFVIVVRAGGVKPAAVPAVPQEPQGRCPGYRVKRFVLIQENLRNGGFESKLQELEPDEKYKTVRIRRTQEGGQLEIIDFDEEGGEGVSALKIPRPVR